MIRKPLLASVRPGTQTSRPFPLPPPVGGWNTRDPLAGMPATDAVLLDNFFPSATEVTLRKGATDWVTGFASPPLTLMPWNGQSSSKLFAAAANGIFNVTITGAVGAAVSACTAGYYSWCNTTTAGGHYLVAVNGTNKLKLYNGAAWADIDGVSVPAITGLATTSLRTVTLAANRLWFTENTSMSAWYLPVGAIAGALTEFPLGSIFGRGGKLINIATWTLDGGNGSDDLTVFFSSEGEVAVYSGTDPAFAATWRKIGVYYIGEPVGRNCYTKYGGDLLVLCQNGLTPLSKALQTATIDRSQALTAKIDPTFTQVLSTYAANPGWQVIAYPQGSFLLANVPITTSYTHQYVMNSITKAWCRFTGWNVTALEVFGSDLFGTTQTTVAKLWTGVSDYGTAIDGKVQQAYNYLGSRGRQKQLKLVRPIITIDNSVTLKIGVDTDFAVSTFTSITTPSATIGYTWDTARWDTVTWAASAEVNRDWASVFAFPCYAAALRLQVSTASATLSWAATDIIHEPAGLF
jgi:hypothetical protein